jgi:hypothetical protein
MNRSSGNEGLTINAMVLSALLLFAGGESYVVEASAQSKPASTLPAPGTVLGEASRSIGHSFREVQRSEVNPPRQFEGIGHFVFVYYKNEKLCQCGKEEIAISPNGEYAIFADVSTGKLILFHAASRSRREITQEFAGYPKAASWDLAARRAVVTLEKYENGVGSIHKLTVPL